MKRAVAFGFAAVVLVAVTWWLCRPALHDDIQLAPAAPAVGVPRASSTDGSSADNTSAPTDVVTPRAPTTPTEGQRSAHRLNEVERAAVNGVVDAQSVFRQRCYPHADRTVDSRAKANTRPGGYADFIELDLRANEEDSRTLVVDPAAAAACEQRFAEAACDSREASQLFNRGCDAWRLATPGGLCEGDFGCPPRMMCVFDAKVHGGDTPSTFRAKGAQLVAAFWDRPQWSTLASREVWLAEGTCGPAPEEGSPCGPPQSRKGRGACGRWLTCGDDGVCHDLSASKLVEVGGACSDDEPCVLGAKCVAGQCRSMVFGELGEPCDPPSSLSIKSKASIDAWVAAENRLVRYCRGAPENLTCVRAGGTATCQHRSNAGEACEPLGCVSGTGCVDGICRVLGAQGEACTPVMMGVMAKRVEKRCASPWVCVDDFCR